MSDRRTRDRVLEAGMTLFAEKGYAGTSVAEIEAAAGLSPGSGSLYRHFPSKQALLEQGVARRIEEGRQLVADLAGSPGAGPVDLQAEASAIVVAALRRLDASGDLNRMIVKDLKQFPALMERVRSDELAPVYAAVARWITARSGGGRPPRDSDNVLPGGDPAADGPGADAVAQAAVLVGATAHYWLLRDAFGDHPADLGEDRFVAAMALVAESLVRARSDGAR